METDTAISNGQNSILTPSKLNTKQTETKSFKYKRKIRDTESESEHIDFLYEQLTKEQENNEYLKKELSEMRLQIGELTKTIHDLNDTIKKLESHNKDLLKSIRKDIKNSKKCSENSVKKTKTQTPTEQKTTSNTQTPKNNTNMGQESEKNTQSHQSKSTMETQVDNTHNINDALNNSKSDTNSNIESDEEEEQENSSNTQNNIHEFNENEGVQRSSKIPPIDIWTENQQATQILIRHHMPKYSCIFNKINKTKMRVTTKTPEIRLQLIELLQDRKIQYNTYTPSDDRMQNILLKGTDIENEEIISQTLEKNGIQPYSIRKFETGYMRKNKITSNIWQITLQPKTDTNTVLGIRYIAEWSVKWEVMRKPTITQCRRCQRFNHSASNCTLPYRCVKCANTHNPGECPIDRNTNKTKPTCVNCKGEHTANNARLCPTFKKQLDIKEQKKQPKRKNTPHNNRDKTNNNTKSYTDSKYSYANIITHQKRNENETALNRNENNNKSTLNIYQLLEKNKQSINSILNAFMESQCEMINALMSKNGTN